MTKLIDMTGRRYGKLTVIARGNNKGKRVKWICKCDCGKILEIDGTLLRIRQRSCGCARKENIKHGMTNSRLYSVWSNMRSRCTNPNNKKYPAYGGRGITVCEEWQSFEPFMEWALANGYDEKAPRGQCTLDRIDFNGNYCPENCRWATNKTQCNNTRQNRILEHNGERHTMAEWAEITGINQSTISLRINKRGWTIEEALTIEPNYGNRVKKHTKAG